jgi:hypothetical protein
MLVALNVLMALLFGLSAALQWNDPDPVPWMLIYGVAAVTCVLFIARRFLPWLVPALVGAAAFGWAVVLVPKGLDGMLHHPKEVFSTLHMMSPNVEEAREMLGLVVVGLWMLVLVIVALRRRGRRRHP